MADKLKQRRKEESHVINHSKGKKTMGGMNAAGNAKLKVETEGGTKVFICMFNPEEYNLKAQGRLANLDRSQGNSPVTQYSGGDADSLDLTLFFDTSGAANVNLMAHSPQLTLRKATDVSVYTEELIKMIRMNGKLHRPPRVEFCWGSLSFTGFVDNVGVQYTMFEADGKPVRAKVTLHMQTADKKDGKGNPLQSPDRTKCRVLTADSNIWNMAHTEYGDSGQWRRIATANRILDPMHIPEGIMLSLPPLIEE